MFSEENILQHCDLCKKCEEVRKCPVRADACRRQVTSAFIPVSAIDHVIHNQTLFTHIENNVVTIHSLTEQLGALHRSIFKEKTKTQP